MKLFPFFFFLLFHAPPVKNCLPLDRDISCPQIDNNNTTTTEPGCITTSNVFNVSSEKDISCPQIDNNGSGLHCCNPSGQNDTTSLSSSICSLQWQGINYQVPCWRLSASVYWRFLKDLFPEHQYSFRRTIILLAAALLRCGVKALVRWANGKRLTDRLPNVSLIPSPPPWNWPDIRVSVSPTGGSKFWASTSIVQILHMRKFTFL